MTSPAASRPHPWPSLPLEAWQDTCATLHLWTQIVGKVRLAQTPWINHSWHVPLYVTARGLTTTPIPYAMRAFQIDFEFIDHLLVVTSSDGGVRRLPLRPQSVSAFYSGLQRLLAELDLDIRIHARPNEVADPIPFAQDDTHASYDAEYANRFWRILLQAHRVFTQSAPGSPVSAARCISSGAPRISP